MLEGFLFEEPALLGRVEELIRKESPRVLAAFRVNRPPSWFEHPQRADDKKTADTRRFRLGMVLERLLSEEVALLDKVENAMSAQSPLVRSSFAMDEGEGSWFGEHRRRAHRGDAA